MRKTAFAAMTALAVTFVQDDLDLRGMLSRHDDQRVVVRFDPGGSVADYLRWYQRLADSGIKIQIAGTCISACTLVLTLPPSLVCILPSASLGFHLASDANGRPLPDETAELVKAVYPPKIQKWIKDHGPLTVNVIYLSGAEAIKMGVLPACKE